MLFLLRQIRRKLLTNNKVITYLLYAMGEIILVVVGILLAVQIDDVYKREAQNELKKTILNEIYTNIGKDISRLESEIVFLDQVVQSSQFVVDHLDGKSVNTDSIGYNYARIYASISPLLNNAGYESLKSIGMSLIDDDSLRQVITNFYSGTHQLLKNLGQLDNSNTINILAPQLNRHIRSVESYYSEAYPVDINQLKKDNEFRETLLQHITIKSFIKENDQNAIAEMKLIRQLINQSLNKDK